MHVVSTKWVFKRNPLFSFSEFKKFGRRPFEKMSTLLAHLGPPDQQKNHFSHVYVLAFLKKLLILLIVALLDFAISHSRGFSALAFMRDN